MAKKTTNKKFEAAVAKSLEALEIIAKAAEKAAKERS